MEITDKMGLFVLILLAISTIQSYTRTVMIPHSTSRITGSISITRRGMGFVAAENSEDILVSPENTGTAFNGDTVEVELLPTRGGLAGKKRPKKDRKEGRVVAVVQRAREEFVGTLTCIEGKNRRQCTLVPDNPRIPVIFRIPAPPEDAKTGVKALIRLVGWANPLMEPEGTIVRVLGESGRYLTEMEAIVLSQDFSLTHAPDAEAEARGIAEHREIPNTEIAKRRDFRAIPTFTIDPEDAKDFDDALSVRVLENGTYEIGVHIADVTHYVRPGSSLDREARERATSIYLPGLTVPMLPEELSSDICSLRPNEDRLTFSAVFVLDAHAHILDRWFGKTIIRSAKRFTYHEAQKVLDDAHGPHATELRILDDLALIMRRDRTHKGAISFETNEVRFQLDASGKPVKVLLKDRIETMKMIEDWMLLANREVATWLAGRVKDKKAVDQTFVFRVHDTPDSERVEGLRTFLKALGYDLGKPGTKIKAHDINRLFKEAENSPEFALIQMATLRAMAKATYTHKNIGHFSLGFSHYTHFTSPIRRYPDMIVHRILASHLHDEPLSEVELLDYQRRAISSSEREVAAVECERAAIRYMHVLYMQKHIGETFEGIVTGVADQGIFVEERTTKAEGLIPLNTLEDDYYVVDRTHYRIVGERTRKMYRMGDTVTIRLHSADPLVRLIEWRLV